METSLVDLLVNGSPMAAFALFLIYLYKTQMSRMDTLVDKFQDQIEKMRKEYKEDIEEIRKRYDAVISTYNEEAKDTRNTVSDKLGHLINTLKKVGSELNGMYISHESGREEIRQLTHKVEEGIKMIQAMQEEARLREIARSAAQRDG